MALELSPDVHAEVRGHTGFITLNRPKALNALSLQMVRDLMACLLHWQSDPAVAQVAIRGSNKEGPFGAFCAGGDIRFLREAALGGNPQLEDFFTEEYALNHLIHRYPKPYIAFMDGIVMGGGMGISQGAAVRIVTERTRMAMPETIIGLFPDVGGGYFLSRCPGRIGEFLALTGDSVTPDDAVHWGLADIKASAAVLASAWQALEQQRFASAQAAKSWAQAYAQPLAACSVEVAAQSDQFFGGESAQAIQQALDAQPEGSWARTTAATLRKRSPLMVAVVLEQIRRSL